MTIRVKVELMPIIRSPRKERKFDLELPDNTTLRELLTKLEFKGYEIEHLRIFVNNKSERVDKVLKDNDEVWVGAVVGGG